MTRVFGGASYAISNTTMGMRLVLAGAMAACLFALAGAMQPAAAQAVADSLSAEEIETLMAEAGLSPSLMADGREGTPVAMGKLGEVNFVVRALDCEGRPVRCSQLLLFANFSLGREATDEDYRIVNDFNDSSFDGRAYVLEATNEIGIDFTIDLTGGVTGEHVESRLSRWQGVVSDFLSEMRQARTGS